MQKRSSFENLFFYECTVVPGMLCACMIVPCGILKLLRTACPAMALCKLIQPKSNSCFSQQLAAFADKQGRQHECTQFARAWYRSNSFLPISEH